MKQVELYTDGACSGNPGAGGYGAILIYKGIEREISGGEKKTTNNRMEIFAVIAGLECLKEKCKVNISEISKNLSITPPSTTEFVKNLINKGYLEKHVSPKDKRFIEITLTDDGKKIVQDLKKYFNSLFSGIIEKLGTEQSKLLIELLDIVNIYFEEWYSSKNRN